VVICPPNTTVQCYTDIPLFSVQESDNCNGAMVMVIMTDTTNRTCYNRFILTRTVRATDSCGNSATCSQVITVNDNNGPTITCPGPLTVSCAAQVPPPDTNLVIVSDGCTGGSITRAFVSDVISGQTCANRYTLTRTYRATDICGNVSTCTQIITVNDQTPPTLTCPGPLTVSCSSDVPAPNISLVTGVSDNCVGTVTVSHISDVISGQTCANRYTITRTYRATDVCGNTAQCTQTITVNDQTPPTLTCPGPVTVSCASQLPPVNINSVTGVSDNCPGTVTVTHISDVTSGQTCTNRFTVTRTYRATDVCGNTAQCTQIITVNDQTPPTISCPPPATVSCASQVPPTNFAGGSSSDNCGGTPTVIFVSDVISAQTCANRYTITRTYRATDDCGNSSTCTQTITVNDVTPPTITCPPNVTTACAGGAPPANFAGGSATDNCGGVPTVTHVSDVYSSAPCQITRTYRATDACGNSATCVQIITLSDAVPPVITCPTTVTVSCTNQVPPPLPFGGTVSDNCGGTPTVVHVGDVISGQTCTNRYTITRTYRATDACGNTATCAAIIIVNDQTGPTLTCPTNVTVQCDTDIPLPGASASDNCNGLITVTLISEVRSNVTCTHRFTLTRTYRATDECGNSSQCTQTITVFDNTPPVINCPINLTVQCATDVPLPGATASDNCSGLITVTLISETISNQTCANRFTVTRVYRATDVCGNSSQCTQVITVFDNTPPTLTCPANTTVQCAADVPPVNVNTVTNVSDNCGGTVTVTWVSDVISNQTCANRYTLTRTYRATDVCGNSATCAQIITVFDNTPPTLTCPGPITVSCSRDVPAPNPATVTPTSDNCGGTVTVTWVSDVISNQTCVNRYTLTRTYRATDVCGNSATCTQIITVNDVTAPTITCPPPVTVTCASQVPPANFAGGSSSDNCGGTPTVIFVSDVESNVICVNRKTITRTYRATDECGNSATCTQIITVSDLVPPTITCPANTTVTCAVFVPPALPFTGSASDNCGGTPTITHVGDVITNQTCRDRFTLTRTYRATDACGNSATCAQIITVFDNVAPSVICPAPVTVQCASAVPPVDVNTVITADLCGNAGLVVTHVGDVISGQTCANRFTVTRTYRSTDVCGNSATCSQIITVFDNTAPVVVCRNVTIFLDANGNATVTPVQLLSSVSDNCTATPALVLTAVPSTFTCANIGPNNVNLRATDECGNVGTCLAVVTVVDNLPPVIMGCPTKSPVTINLGPGECEASWDAPPFMAMDNCPAGAYFGNRNTTTVCLPPASYWSITGGAASWGVMFDLINTSGSLLNLQLLGERAFANVPHNIYYTTNPGGHAPVVATPNAWTLCATRTPTSGAQFTTVIDSFRLLTGTRTDTIKRCAPIQTETTVLGCLTMAPGETRGIYIHAPGTGGTNASLFSGCAGRPMGDANIRTPIDGATYTGGQFAAPFINSSFGFGGANWMGVIGYNLANSNRVPLVQTCGAPYGPGCFFPIGCTKLCYRATDASGNVGTCEFEVCVNKYANPTRALACNDDIQISLDDSCRATIYPDMVLEGGPYSCYDDYIVEVRDWKGGPLIDRDPNRRGVQINGNDIGRELKITIIDPVTGNSCWGHGRVEDKIAPYMTCPPDVSLSCGSSTAPSVAGQPSVYENCGGASIGYRDSEVQGGCPQGYARRITRTWTATDASGNKSVCVQTITVKIGDLFEVTVPANYDNLDQAALECDEKIDRNKNVTPHMSDFPECVDGYILDSAFWLANPNAPDQYPNRRLPRVLGWNCIDDVNDPHYGHPSPDPVYYPQHRQWSPNNPLCWGPDRHIMWVGTGRPGGAECSNLTVTYKDIVFDLATPGCDAGPVGCFKVLRQWTVMDWCTSQVGGHNQIIKVIDDEGPQVLYPDSARVNMESWTCTGRWEVPAPWILDNCSNEVHYTVEVDNGTVLGDETAGFVVLDMPEGIYNGYIVATDCCGNITKKRIVLNVIDRVPPQAVCRTATVVSLNGNQSPLTNYARLHAEDLDEGSFDNCQPHVYFKVIRMAELLGTNNGSNSNNVVACQGRNGDDNSILAGNQIYFDDYTDFCCADVGTKVMVVLRVFDVDPGPGPVTPIRMTSTSSVLNGRFSDCMVEVEVQNKAVPTVIAPPNIVVSCWFWFDVTKLTNPNDATFGKVVTSLTDRRKVVTKDLVCYKFCERNDYTGYPGYVQTNAQPKPAPNQACEYYYQYFDTAHWDRKYELTWGFDGYVLSPCGSTPTITVNDLRECGQGVIQRIISTTGPNNINVTAIQTIWVVDCDPFYIDDVACNDPRYTDLLWPNGVCTQTPVTLDGCGADISPDNPQLGRPQVINNADDNCALLSIEYFDEQFNIEPDACFKVLRRWVVIDWCQYDPFIDPDHGRWEALQVIKVRDQNRPVVSCNVGPCEPAKIDSKLGVCVGHISLTASATDNCTPADWLFWEYKIDAFNDGKGVHGGYDFRVGTLTSKQYAAGDTVEFSHNPFADDSHNPFNASGTYPIGIHKIKWFVEDGCGNVGVCESLFEIKDCKAPTPYCLTGVITVPMPSSGCVDIWAKDLDKGSYDNCTSQENLKLYFDNDPTKTSITVCCDDFVNAGQNDELIIDVELWVEDEEGNKDYCKTIIVVQDNQDICPDKGSAKGKISGNIKTETGVETKPVEVSLFHNGSMMRQMMGSPYSFGDLAMNTTYSVKPERNDEHANGVTTQDIVKIQKHILGLAEITDPYKLLAADVNASKTITASDMAELRKLILGINSEFRNVKSWTFVPADYVFADPKSPWDAPRSADLMLDKSKVVDFISVKMGDVTGDSRANGAQGIQSRTNGKLSFEIKDQEVVAGESYRVSFKSSDFRNISGYQFTLKFDQSSLMYEGTESGVLKTTEANFGTKRVSEGMLTTSWNADKGLSYGKEDELFVINFTATRNGVLSKMMAINSNITSAQAYDEKDNLLEPVMGVRTDRGIVESGVFELYQNEPNPFSKETVVSYRLPESGAVKLTVYDVTGKVLRVYELKGQKGLNHHQISKGDLNATGVLYYQLDAADHTATKKMISVE